jgi:hypothetical protein
VFIIESLYAEEADDFFVVRETFVEQHSTGQGKRKGGQEETK